MELNQKIRKLREFHEWSQEEMAALKHIISLMEKG